MKYSGENGAGAALAGIILGSLVTIALVLSLVALI
jgi:hypothetical protein